ncbi:uncharacterized protein K444DRAFT_718760 [Hyaloscypha bicolor E]|uniref:Uncharacterized protein n=1 Tax=Hyaloscypha bicolor E TaxID=1095630 RepID=A0A2J6TG86_9HELO|nr:uncharacterized protein K444DRAFT_718760 [Hyaloscypha bicolor E]PMD62031.1 hypothetical protein K444DRAFT_718760 [Hyaloscypha bicolor E]
MVRNEEQKKITLYIAKNQSEKGYGPLAYGDELGVAANENKVFADELVRCFNTLAKEGSTHTEHPDVFKTMCKFSQSRLEHYIGKISQVEGSCSGGEVDQVPWSTPAAYVEFCEFCTDKKQSGYSFEYQLLPSQEDEWLGETYMQKIQSWSGDLSLNEAQLGRMDGIDMVIKQISLGSLESYAQTSARMTPSYRRATRSGNPGQDFESGLFSDNPIKAPGRLHAVAVPALHLPAGDSLRNSRQVEVFAYEEDGLNEIESLEQFHERPIMFAFQLITNPKSLGSTLKIKQTLWNREDIWDEEQGESDYYMMFYPIAKYTLVPDHSIEHPMDPNPRVLSI